MIERGIDGTSVYLIRISYLENDALDLCNNPFILYYLQNTTDAYPQEND